jgi:hypothetical protein
LAEHRTHDQALRLSQEQQARKRRTRAINVQPAKVVPVNADDPDYQQAITTLATMIASWWRTQHHNHDAEA